MYWNIEYEVNEGKRDKLTEQVLQESGIDVHKFHDQCVIQPGVTLTQKGLPFSQFGVFKKVWIFLVGSSLEMVP